MYLDADGKKVEDFVHQGLAIFLEFVELGFVVRESRWEWLLSFAAHKTSYIHCSG